MENLDFFHRPAHFIVRSIYKITYFKWFEYQNHQSSCKVGKIAREGHTDSHTGRCQQGGQAGGLHTQLADDGKGKHQIQEDAKQALEKCLHAHFKITFHQNLGHQLHNLPDDETTDDVNDDGCKDVLACLHPPIKQFLGHLSEIDSRNCIQ